MQTHFCRILTSSSALSCKIDSISQQISGCCFPIRTQSVLSLFLFFPPSVLCFWGWKWAGTSPRKTFSLPIFPPLPCEPTLAKPHDRQVIKEGNGSAFPQSTPSFPRPAPPQHFSVSFSDSFSNKLVYRPPLPFLLKWSPQQLPRCPSPLPSLWLWKWSGIIHAFLPLYICSEKKREESQSLHFFIHFSCGHFALQAVLTFLKGAHCAEEVSRVTSMWEGGWPLILKGSPQVGLLLGPMRTHSTFWIRRHFTDPFMEALSFRTHRGMWFKKRRKRKKFHLKEMVKCSLQFFILTMIWTQKLFKILKYVTNF